MDTPIKEVHSIKIPRAVSDLIDQCVNDQKDRYRIRGRDMMGSLNHEDCDCEHDDVSEGEVEYDDGYAGE